jgi:hypothetical protein
LLLFSQGGPTISGAVVLQLLVCDHCFLRETTGKVTHSHNNGIGGDGGDGGDWSSWRWRVAVSAAAEVVAAVVMAVAMVVLAHTPHRLKSSRWQQCTRQSAPKQHTAPERTTQQRRR